MKSYLFIPAMFLIALMLSSCYTPKSVVNNSELRQKGDVMNFILLYVDSSDEIFEWNEEYYNRLLKGKFNNLERSQFRQVFHDKFRRKFNPTFVHNYADYFSTHKEYSFEEFNQQLSKQNIDHILLVSQKSSKSEVMPLVVGDWVLPATSNRNHYQVYLLERDNPNPIWISYGYGLLEGGWYMRPKKISKYLAKTIRRAMEQDELLFAGNRTGRASTQTASNK
ncbi:hypothetical protein [Arthrospiribacter ruber]|uniref:Uncharacterized protein n=1 Tax=Arthrospiribacter ruber TaxID=2487934 RepID=A0A951J5R8_9BACT|nr:hypothetical protein [Arthrospiribacter ruber]MBW3470043.1 hypothetical protein [Arthrospiribacter ruber]